MHAVIRSISWDDHADRTSSESAEYSWSVRVIAGPSTGPGDESFDLTVCTPEWVAHRTRQVGGIYDARHHVLVDLESFDRAVVEAWITKRVTAVTGGDWAEVGQKLSRLGYWEFEDYTPYRQ